MYIGGSWASRVIDFGYSSSGGPVVSPPATVYVGVPAINPNYSQDISTWWVGHPFNPANTVVIDHSATVIDVTARALITDSTSGETNCYDLPGAIAAIPAGGATLLCQGTVHPYARATLTGQSHVHFLGNTAGGTTFRGLNLCGDSLTTPTNYGTFVGPLSAPYGASLKGYDAHCISVSQNPTSDYYLSNITFDANGYVPTVLSRGTYDYCCLGTYGVRDVLADNCTFQGLSEPASPPGNGFCTGIGGMQNIWLRNCAFHGFASAPSDTSAWVWDGPIACGMVNCSFDGYFSKGTENATDEDMTVDTNQDGTIDSLSLENRMSRYCVFSGLTSTAVWNPFFSMEGTYLVENCSHKQALASMGYFVANHSRNLDNWSVGNGGYVSIGSVVRNNTVDKVSIALVDLDGTWLDNANSPETPGGHGTNALGRITITNNTVTSGTTPALAIFQPNQAISTPNTVTGNSPNDTAIFQ